MNKKGSKKADGVLFRNCRIYLIKEISILCPKIIVTQGDEAKSAILNLCEDSLKKFDGYASLIKLNGSQIFWINTYHPSNRGAFNKQRSYDKARNIALGWERYSKLVYKHVV